MVIIISVDLEDWFHFHNLRNEHPVNNFVNLTSQLEEDISNYIHIGSGGNYLKF